MSNCLIRIKIGDQEILIDPTADISKDQMIPLSNIMSADKLRLLYSQLKSELNIEDRLVVSTAEDIDAGRAIYDEVFQAGWKQGERITLLSQIQKEKDPVRLKALAAYASSLDPREVLDTANYAIDPREAYKASPYSVAEIRDLVFIKDGEKVKLFDELMALPGMETVKMSIAYASTWNGKELTEVQGTYITPDNIIQIVIPAKHKDYQKIEDNPDAMVNSGNILPKAKNGVQNVLIHEVMHAVYSELYQSNPDFKLALDIIHQKFLAHLTEKGKGKSKEFAVYEDVHEFLAFMFIDAKLQDAMSKVPLQDDIDVSGSLFDAFTGIIEDKIVAKKSLLKEYIKLVGQSLPKFGIDGINDTRALDILTKDRTSMFFTYGLYDSEFQENASPRDQYDSKYSINKKAYHALKRFQKKYEGVLAVTDEAGRKKDTFKRDHYYKATIIDPSPAELDRLYADDVIIMPWLRYIKAVKDAKTGKWVSPGRYVEVGFVLDKEGKTIKKNGKDWVDEIKRDDKGQIIPREDGNTYKEMLEAFPVMYANLKKKQVVIAKRGLPDTAENPKPGDNNTMSFPYHMIKGIRKLDREYFDHNDNYEEQIKDAESQLLRAKLIAGAGDKKADSVDFYTNHIERLKKYVQKASDVKNEMKYLHKMYGFSFKDPETGKIYMNVSREDYIASGYKTDDLDKRVFAEEPIFMLKQSKYPSKLGGTKSYTYPNPKLFHLFWEEGDIGKEYAKTSEEMGEAVAAGDLVRIRKTEHFPINGTSERADVKMARWMTVYKKVANGVIATTPEGKGWFIPFRGIEAYAKNKNTAEYKLLLATYHNQIADFEDDIYSKTPDGKRHFNKEHVKFKSTIYSPKYHAKPDETEEASIKRFAGNLERIKQTIKPNETFVRVQRKFVGRDGKTKSYSLNGLVLAKGEKSLVILTENAGGMHIETIAYDQRIKDTDQYGWQLEYVMENTAVIDEVWKEFATEREEYEENKKEANFLYGKENWAKINEPSINPHSTRDAYDFYETINGNTIAKLRRGDIVAIKMNFDKMTPEERAKYKSDVYYRKVIRTLADGTVVVADYNKTDRTLAGGFKITGGTVYARYVPMDKIAKIGKRLGAITQSIEDREYHSEFNEDLLARRKKLWENAKRDKDFDSFSFATDMASVRALNSKPIQKYDYWRYVPLTNKILDPVEKGVKDDRETIFLDRNFNEVAEKDSAWVMATFTKNTEDFKSVHRGMNVTTKMLYKDIIVEKNAKGYDKFKKEFLDEVRVGDWVTTKNPAGQWWDAVIERIEGGDIYVLNTDFTTQKASMGRLVGVRFSKRNEKFSNFNRADDLIAKLSGDAAKIEARAQKKAAKAAKRKAGYKPAPQKDTEDPPFSLEADYKSPKSSRRALIEIGNRLTALNPDIKINYVYQDDLRILAKETGHNYDDARAFVLNGEVFINLERASVSDVVHEYAHLFLHTLKYENPELYQAVIAVTNKHSLYGKIANQYIHLGKEDLDEEVFVTVLGEYMGGNLSNIDKDNMDNNKDLMLGFASYTKHKLSEALNKTVESIYDLDPKEILNLSIQDVIDLVGDDIMKNRISDRHEGHRLRSDRDISKLKQDLAERGLLTQECYG